MIYQLIALLKVAFSAAFVIVLPGVCLSWALYPRKEDLDAIERTVMSFGLGLASVSITMFYMNKLVGIPVNMASGVIMVLLISASSLLVWRKRRGAHAPIQKTHRLRK